MNFLGVHDIVVVMKTEVAIMPRKKYTKEYKELLRSYGIRQSMDGRSRWADNIMIERWFRSLKTEPLYPNEYHTPRELRQLINQYVDAYNGIRPHEALGYEVPDKLYFNRFAA